jgi:hypothetical protein
MILLRQVPNVVEIRDGWKLYIVAGGVMVRILLNAETCSRMSSVNTLKGYRIG